MRRCGAFQPRRFPGYHHPVVVPGVILAGGRSTRMGRPKALLPVDARDTFVSRLVRTLRDGGVRDVVVVAAADGPVDAIRSALAGAPPTPRIALNPDPSRGQLSSLLAGLQAVDHPGVDALLVTLVDVPLVCASTVRALIEAYARTRAPIVRPSRRVDAAHPGWDGDSAGRRHIVRPSRRVDAAHGHPVIFDRSLFDDLRGADPDAGAKPVVRARATAIEDVPVDDRGAFLDIDTPADYRRVFGRSVPVDPSSRVDRTRTVP